MFVAALSLVMLQLLPSSGGAAFTASVACRRRQSLPSSRRGCDLLLHLVTDSADGEVRITEGTTIKTNIHNYRLGLLRGVDPAVDNYYANEIDMSEKGLAWLDQPGLMWEAAKKDAEERGVPVEIYISEIKAKIDAFLSSGISYDREELSGYLKKSFAAKGTFTLLLGGKNVGKSTVLKSLTKDANKQSELLVLYVDARLYPGHLEDGLANGILQLASEQIFRKPDTVDLFQFWKDAIDFGREAAMEQIEKQFSSDETGIETKRVVKQISRFMLGLALNRNVVDRATAASQKLLDKFIKIAQDQSKFPVLVIDEANEVLGIETKEGKQDDQTIKLLTRIVSYTKQDRKMNVILASSEHAYPYRLEREGFNLLNLRRTIFAGEIPPKEMWNLLVNATYENGSGKADNKMIGMGPNLAELCLSAYGGHVLVVEEAIRGLSSEGEFAEASSFQPNLYSNIKDCLDTNTRSRPLLGAMAKYGFAPITAPKQAAAELISGKNVGGVVTRNAACIGTPRSKWKSINERNALIPSSQCVRLVIAQVL